MAALCAATVDFDDRRRGFRTTGGRDLYLASLRAIGRFTQVTRTRLATAGDRLALEHRLYRRIKDVVLFEIGALHLTEVDGQGRLVADVIFDPDDRVPATAELLERYVAGGVAGSPPGAIEAVQAWNRHDLERLRALLPDDFYLDDRRRSGVGRVEGIDATIASLAAMFELSDGSKTEVLYTVSVAAHGSVHLARWSGTNAEGGELDALYVTLALRRGDQLGGLEVFELDDLDAARARFEELCDRRESGS